MAGTRSPFPGMDPWLEGRWGHLHHELISGLARQVSDVLPPGLSVSIEERVYVLSQESLRRRPQFVPDVAVFEFGAGSAAASTAAVLTAATPIIIDVADDESVTEGYIEIRSLESGEPLVTTVEAISPTDKIDANGRAEYVRKRDACYRAGVNVVEVDLIRAGAPLVDVPLSRIEAAWVTPYKCVVHRGPTSGRRFEYYPLPLRERLPRVRVPLRPADADVTVDLQEPVDDVYVRGRYASRIDYSIPPDPPLSADDAAWAAERVAAAAAG
jgi:hypothetical protein